MHKVANRKALWKYEEKNIKEHVIRKRMQLCGTLENILTHAENIKKPSIKESIIRNTGKLRTNYKIIRLGGYKPLPLGKQELQYCYAGITTNEVLKGIGLR